MNNKVLLLILDGYGINSETKGNAIFAAKPQYINSLFESYPYALLEASGLAVGLPKGNMGNSEVGHLNIGAGRVVYQMNTLIDKEIETGEFFRKESLLASIEHTKKNKSKLHLLGLLSDGNVHSNIEHLWALLNFCKQNNLTEVYYHAFMDGRDTLPNDGIRFMKQFLAKSQEIGIGKIATISGRYYAMDRDNRWERIEKAYRALVEGTGEFSENPLQALEASYAKGITDEFIVPKVMMEKGEPIAKVEENDSIIFFNFRADRAREITRALLMPDFDKFERTKFANLHYTVFNEYDIVFSQYYHVAFRLPELTNILGKIISENNLKQLRLAETEKYAHVTFFFNGGVEEAFPNEHRTLVPSSKVATYDLKPEMSAYEVQEQLIKELDSQQYHLIVTNFANCDMVGHTGVFEAAVKAVQTVDICLQKIIPAALKNQYTVIVTADHGNADKMIDENENIFTAHSMNPVPVCIISTEKEMTNIKNGILADIAPTILKIMGITIPHEMLGKTLF
jgi:2,3-bisphosphoglycerate-independent phosphoglycerate mutase